MWQRILRLSKSGPVVNPKGNAMREIGVVEWMDAVIGRPKKPEEAKEIIRLGERRQLIVLGHEGERHQPVKLEDGRWELKPVKK
jgi:hypothetical protein